MKSVAIIGAGITGLTAAYRLHRENIPVTVYEAAPRVGGPIQTIRRDGYLAECGPNSILETSPVIRDLVKALGLEGRRVSPNAEARKRFIARHGKPIAAPDSPAKFFATPLFSMGAKMRLLREPFVPRGTVDEEAVGDFVRRRLGQEFLDYAINPMVGGIYAGDPERLSVQQAFPKLNAVEQKYGSLILGQCLGARERARSGEVSKQNAPMFSFDEGLETLPRTIAEKLGKSVRLNEGARSIRRTESGWEVNDEGHSAVLLAIGAHQLASLGIEAEGAPDLSELGQVVYPPVASVTLGFRRLDVKFPLDGFGVLVPEAEGFNILGTLFTSTLFPKRAPDRHVTLTTYIGGMRAPHLAREPRETIVNYVLTDLRRLLGAEGTPTFEHVHVFAEAIPQYNVGYGRFKRLMADFETAASGVFIAGNARNGISLSDSILAGHNAAERIENHLATIDRSVAESRLAHFEVC